jgi:hypothetical protein
MASVKLGFGKKTIYPLKNIACVAEELQQVDSRPAALDLFGRPF